MKIKRLTLRVAGCGNGTVLYGIVSHALNEIKNKYKAELQYEIHNKGKIM
jgi:hypothetical protein